MKRDAARILMNAAVQTMPRDRRAWAEAMARELDEIEDDGEALTWAAGALLSASVERGLPLLVTGGRFAVAGLTCIYALFHLAMARNGAAMVLFGAPDWYHDKLIEWGHPEAAAAHAAWRPWVMLFMLTMGVSHLGAAIFLAQWRPRLFAAFASAAVISTLFVSLRGAVGAMHGYGPLFWWAQTALAFLLIGAAMLLAKLDRRRLLPAP